MTENYRDYNRLPRILEKKTSNLHSDTDLDLLTDTQKLSKSLESENLNSKKSTKNWGNVVRILNLKCSSVNYIAYGHSYSPLIIIILSTIGFLLILYIYSNWHTHPILSSIFAIFASLFILDIIYLGFFDPGYTNREKPADYYHMNLDYYCERCFIKEDERRKNKIEHCD